MSTHAQCTVCNSPQVSLINDALNSGPLHGSYRGIGLKYGVDKDAVRRHCIGLHPGVIDRRISERVSIPEGASARETLEAMVRHLSKKLAAGVIRADEMQQLRMATNDLEKLIGGSEVVIASYKDVAGWQELEEKIFAALEPFPEARKAVAEAVR